MHMLEDSVLKLAFLEWGCVVCVHLGRQLDFFIFGKMLSKSIFFQVKLMDVFIHKKQMSLNQMKYYVYGLGSRVT